MIRRIAVTGSLVGLLMLTGGCGALSALNPFAPKAMPHRDQLTSAQWRELRLEDADRLNGDGIPGHSAPKTGQLQQMVDFFEFTFWVLPKRTYEYYILGKTPGRYARLMEDDVSADNRRTGILTLAASYDFARVDPYTKRYWQIAQGDPDALVRAAAIRALNRSRDKNAIPVYIKALDDASPLIRLEAAKALANIPDPKAIPGLLTHLAGDIQIKGEGGRLERAQEQRDVRLACADALRNYKDKNVTEALVKVLKEKDFEIAWQARKSLVLMTGRDFLYDGEKWRDYFTKTANPFG